MVGVSAAARSKKSVVGVKHLAGKQLEPLPSNSSCVLALLFSKLDLKLSLQHLWRILHDLREGVLEDFVSGAVQVHHVVFGLFPESFELCLEYQVFVVEGQHVRGRDGHFEDGHVEDAHAAPAGLIFLQFFSNAVVDESFEDGLTNALLPQTG